MRMRLIPPPAARSAVSVVIPCYNYGHYVEGAVRSVLEQDGVDTEVIVVDDASPDGSGEVVRALADRYPEVTAIVHEHNQGHIATYNDGLARARHDYVLLLSADDLLAPGALARATSIMQRFPSVGLVYGFAPDFERTPPAQSTVLPHCTVWRGPAWLTSVCRRGQNPVSTPTGVVRREVVSDFGGYDARLPHTADLLMWLRAAARFDVAYVNGVDQAYYRVHGGNMHVTVFAQLASDLQQRYEAFAALIEESPALPGRDGYLAEATEALVREANRARARLAATAPGSSAEEALADFVQRHGGRVRGRSTRRPGTMPASLRGRLDAVNGMIQWRYWRRFGLRL
jgi:glycosyltransferase involved in cell wall biosynthesis